MPSDVTAAEAFSDVLRSIAPGRETPATRYQQTDRYDNTYMSEESDERLGDDVADDANYSQSKAEMPVYLL